MVTAALESFLMPDDADRREATATCRLLDKLHSDLHVCVETLALFIHTWLSVMPLLSGTPETASQVKRRAHYEIFIHTLSQWLATGQSLIHEVAIDTCDKSKNTRPQPVPIATASPSREYRVHLPRPILTEAQTVKFDRS